MDYLCTTPPELLNTIENVLTLYDTSRSRGTMAGEAASLMSPEASRRGRDRLRSSSVAQLPAAHTRPCWPSSARCCCHCLPYKACHAGTLPRVLWFALCRSSSGSEHCRSRSGDSTCEGAPMGGLMSSDVPYTIHTAQLPAFYSNTRVRHHTACPRWLGQGCSGWCHAAPVHLKCQPSLHHMCVMASFTAVVMNDGR